MKLSLRSAAGWLPLLAVVLSLSACGGGGGGGKSSGSGGPPPPPATPPPSALSYASPQNYDVGTAITPLDPTVTGTVTSYSVAPALPAGLSLDAATGRISGTPTQPARATHTVTATNGGGSTTFALTIAVLGERTTSDRSDEQTDRRQVHVMYVIPSDGVDEHLDQSATIDTSLKIANEWLKTQTGGKGLRLDTYGSGKLDVTFLKLTKTDDEMKAAGGNVRSKLEYQLLANGFTSVDKVYLVYYGGGGDGCGRGAWPPLVPGNVGALYVGAAACVTQPYAASGQPPGFLEYLAVHEALHVLGFVAPCAPHQTDSGHASDSPQDIMYSGPQGWQPSTLDVNHDDYYGSAIPGCRDLANSAFLEPLPAGAEAPPGWPYVTLEDLGCANEGTTIPGPAGVATQVMFVNTLSSEALVYERVPNGTGYGRSYRINVPANDGVVLSAFQGVNVAENSVFAVLANGTCKRLVRASANASRFVIK
jgi:hypothetical protein